MTIKINNFDMKTEALHKYGFVAPTVNFSTIDEEKVWNKLKGLYHTMSRPDQTYFAVELVGTEQYLNLMKAFENYK